MTVQVVGGRPLNERSERTSTRARISDPCLTKIDPEVGRRDADETTEGFGEMPMACKAERMRDRRDARLGLGEKLCCPRDTALHEIAVRRDARRRPERACEMVRA